MCGIAGLASVDRPSNPQELLRIAQLMADSMVHRGPDDAGVWAPDTGDVALAHRRLSIIDLSRLGHNPMSWHDGDVWITFNGEIYNFGELRRELESAGYTFRSRTDTEVILAAYDRWGLDCVQRFVGMFAIALWDGSRRRLWLVRDRLGKKPLYFAEVGGRLLFGSELKALLTYPAFPRDIDHEAIRLYLEFGYVPSPLTIYRAARKVPPGHFLLMENGRTTMTRYWDPVPFAVEGTAYTAGEAERALEEQLRVAVGQRMIADVPLGAFLSGGIDSSLIVALMREHTRAPVKTFTIRFENPEFNEADHAADVARHLGTEHHEQTCTEAQMLAVVDQLPEMYDEPFADSSAVPTYLVSKIAREMVTVSLSGDGGDELFFGYPRYRYHASAASILALPRPLRRGAAFAADRVPTRRARRIADVLRNDQLDYYARFVSFFTPAEIADLTGAAPAAPLLYADALARSMPMERAARPCLLDLVSYLPEDILTKVDRASMAVSLEVRAPLLDHRVVELALNLPLGLKRRGRTMKWILRQMLYRRVPAALIDRPKMGFGVPLADWFRGPLRERMESYCSGPELFDLGVEPGPIRAMWREFQQGRSHRVYALWLMFSLMAWARRFRSTPAALSLSS